ncbi:putative YL1 nuclear protein [Balamuthia mandrillaris]
MKSKNKLLAGVAVLLVGVLLLEVRFSFFSTSFAQPTSLPSQQRQGVQPPSLPLAQNEEEEEEEQKQPQPQEEQEHPEEEENEEDEEGEEGDEVQIQIHEPQEELEHPDQEQDTSKPSPTPKLTITAEDVAFVAAPDNQSKYLIRAMKWIRSLRLMGGTLANATAVLMFPAEPPPDFVKAVQKYNPVIRVTGKTEAVERCAPAHKVNIFKVDGLERFRFVVMMDCDTVFLRDITMELESMTCDSVYARNGGKIRGQTRTNMLQFAAEDLGISLPWHREHPQCKHISSTASRNSQPEEFPYFNAAMIILPKAVYLQVSRLWPFYNEFLAVRGEHWFCDQASLTLTLAALDVPYTFLPGTLSLGYVSPWTEDRGDVAVLHYHHNEGKKSGELPLPNAEGRSKDAIAAYNKAVKANPEPYLSKA